MLRNVHWHWVIAVSGQPFGPIFKGQTVPPFSFWVLDVPISLLVSFTLFENQSPLVQSAMTTYLSALGIALELPDTWRWDRFSRNVGVYQSTLLNIPDGRRSRPVLLFTRLSEEENGMYSKLGTCWFFVSCGVKPRAAFSCREVGD